MYPKDTAKCLTYTRILDVIKEKQTEVEVARMQNRTDLSNYGEWKFMVVSFHVLKFESWVHKSAYLRWKAWSLCVEDIRKINTQWGGLESTGRLGITGAYILCFIKGSSVIYSRSKNIRVGVTASFTDGTIEARDGRLSSVRVCTIVLVPCHTLPLWMHGAVFCTVMYSVFFSSILSPKLNRKLEIKIFRIPSNNWGRHRHKSLHIQKVLIYAKKAKAIAEKYKGQQIVQKTWNLDPAALFKCIFMSCVSNSTAL